MYIFDRTKLELNVGIVVFVFITFASGTISNGIDLDEHVTNERKESVRSFYH